MRVISFILAVLFFASAAVQFNDPDPRFWVTLYGAVGLVALFAGFNRYNLWVILLGLAVCTYEGFKLVPAFWAWLNSGAPSIVESMKAESPHIEVVREFLGLGLCFIALVFFYIRGRKAHLAARTEDTATVKP